jgi:hypothetical protein
MVTLVCWLSLNASAQGGEWKTLINPGNSFAFSILNGDQAGDHAVLNAGTGGWGPNWSWFSLESHEKATGDELDISSPVDIAGKKATIGLNVKSDGPNSAVYTYKLSADNDVPILQIVASIGVTGHGKDRGEAVFTLADGSEKTTSLPLTHPVDFGVVSKITLTGKAWEGPVVIALDPPTMVNGDNDLRVRLAAETIKAGTTSEKLTWTFPSASSLLFKKSDVEKYAPEVTTSDWFEYTPKWTTDPSAIGAEDCLDKPAGRHGGVRIKGDQFICEDGTPIKFWGTNLAYGACAPQKDVAEFTAARFAKYGINAVRLHKFTGAGWEGIGDENDSTQMTADGLDRLDYFASQLAKNGVYYGWSHSYHFRVQPGNRDRIVGYDELRKKGGDTYAVINWAEDVQDLLIDRVVNLLKHKNPYTGKTYAEDPALSYVETHNEDDIFFWTTPPALSQYPTYARLLQKHYVEWLTSKYGSQDKLAAAWDGAIKPDETLESGNIPLNVDLYQMSEQPMANHRGGARQRLLDTAAFLHYTQDKFYTKFAKKIREAGYQGPLVGSPWQAPSGLPDLYNLKSDSDVGYVDRHNYFGEGFADSMLANPGSGYLSSGLQQVAGRPFGISEWIHVYPSLYSAEGPVLMAAYGFGLQGWSASYEFQSAAFPANQKKATVGGPPWSVWNADVPTQIGQSPILSRMILRGDVTTGPVISVRRVSPENLETGKFDFSDLVQQQGDVKSFSGSVSPESLAAGRDLLEFVDQTTPSTFADLSKYKQGSVITSATGQLKWDTADGGFVTIDTPGTQGYVGFAQGKQLTFGNLTISPDSPYASVLVTAADLKSNLANANRVLISAIARNSNKGFRVLTLAPAQSCWNRSKRPSALLAGRFPRSIFSITMEKIRVRPSR